MNRYRILRAALIVPVVCMVFLVTFSAIPTQTAHACLPCNCTDIRSVNCWGPYELYTPATDDSCAIDIWLVEGDSGRRYVRVTSAQLAKLPEFPEHNMLIRERGPVALYKLTSGEYQVNVGPDAEGKVYTTTFTGCPAENVYEGNFVANAEG